jgi:hypothetical protein
MKSLLISLLASLCTVSAFSQEQIYCGRPDQVISLIQDYGETVVFRGSRFLKKEGDREVFSMILISNNESTGTWSLFEAYEDGVVCLIQKGIGGKSPRPGLRT